jgi:NADH:ubiquinone reductase (H+-translocating)
VSSPVVGTDPAAPPGPATAPSSPVTLEPRRPHRVVIVGGGFGGLYAARELRAAHDDVAVTLLDRRNHHLFQPLLYQVATGALSPGEIAQPLRSVFRRQRNVTVLLGEATGIDPAGRLVHLRDGLSLPYDTLIVATGARHSYFGHDEWAPYAPGLKTIDDATEMRRRILIAFEAAEREADPARRREWMTFVLVGGGPTGVELAGALGEIANDTLRNDFRSIHPQDARIELIEALDRILPMYPPDRSASAKRQLERLGVTVRTKTRVTDIEETLVRVEDANGTEEIRARTVLWAAGVLAASFGRAVAETVDAETDRSGRIRVGQDLSIPGHPEILVVGDAAVQPWKQGKPVPGVAQGGIQGGKYAGKVVLARLRGETPKPFHYQDRGDVAVIGRLRGVTNIGWMGPFGRTGGFIAWALWLGIHIVYLIGFANRIVVSVRWAWSFLTRGRSTRLITGAPQVLPIERPEPPGQPSPGAS